MMAIAIASRVLQFRAGPNENRFYTCEECKPALERGDIHCGLFFPTDDEPMRDEDPDEEFTCDLCREG